MSIWIDINPAAEFMNFISVIRGKRTNPTCENIYYWCFYLVFFYIFNTKIQSGDIIINGLCMSYIRYINLKTMSIMIIKFFFFCTFPRNMVFKLRIFLVILCKFF